jgi:hypothetical protein
VKRSVTEQQQPGSRWNFRKRQPARKAGRRIGDAFRDSRISAGAAPLGVSDNSGVDRLDQEIAHAAF